MRYIEITESQVRTLTEGRLKNIFKINRKYIFQTLALHGYNTFDWYKIPWGYVNDELYHDHEFNAVMTTNDFILKRFREINNEIKNNKQINKSTTRIRHKR